MRKKLSVVLVAVFLLNVVSFALALPAYGSDGRNQDSDALATPPQPPQVVKHTGAVEQILVYTDDYVLPPGSRYPIVGLNNLGKSYTHVMDNPAGFRTTLASQTWDIVIVSHCNLFDMGNSWTELDAYVQGGGRLALATFDVDGSHSEATTLWATLGAAYVSDNPNPQPVYRWQPSHAIFTIPNTVGDLTVFTPGYIDNGDHVTTGSPFEALAGFSNVPVGTLVAIVEWNSGKTILMSFTLCEFRADEDTDGKLDAVELWENVISYLQYVCGDVNGDRVVNVPDIVYLINYFFRGGPPPQCPPAPYLLCADATGNGTVDIADVVYLINYVFKSGPPPIC